MFITKKFFSEEINYLIFNLNFKPYDRFGGSNFRELEALSFAKKTVWAEDSLLTDIGNILPHSLSVLRHSDYTTHIIWTQWFIYKEICGILTGFWQCLMNLLPSSSLWYRWLCLLSWWSRSSFQSQRRTGFCRRRPDPSPLPCPPGRRAVPRPWRSAWIWRQGLTGWSRGRGTALGTSKQCEPSFQWSSARWWLKHESGKTPAQPR